MKYNYTKEKTKIDGLSFVPKLIGWGMDEDGAPHGDEFYSLPNSEIHDGERSVVEKITKRYKNFPINIMEIGVSRNGDRSFTNILLENKHPKSKYVGVDIQDKSFLNDDKKSIFTIQTTSMNQAKIRKFMKTHDMFPLSILLIDGWHSVNTAINDWKYSNLVIPGGYVLIHDIHVHPGPNTLMEAINATEYSVFDPTKDIRDCWGMGVARKI